MSIYIADNSARPVPDMDIESYDPSLNGKGSHSLAYQFALNRDDFNRLFLSDYGIEYIAEYFLSGMMDFRIVTHPRKTNTCFEKAELIACDPLNVIKALYFEDSMDGSLYAVIVPEIGCFIDRGSLEKLLRLPDDAFVKKAETLPLNMSFGTCSPFITDGDLRANGGKVRRIIFDAETLSLKKKDRTMDDFSFGLDHRMSIQMNYYHCYIMLKSKFPGMIGKGAILTLSFKEKLVRTNGKINISYQFHSLNYKTARFINGIHGYGDVTILNDYIDELDLPGVLTGARNGTHEE